MSGQRNPATPFLHSAVAASNRSNWRYLTLIGMIWSLPIVLTLLSRSEKEIMFSTLLAGIFCIGLALVRPAAVLLMIPFFALLAPVGGFYSIAGVRLILTDWLFLVLVPQILILLYMKKKLQIFGKLRKHHASMQLFPMLLLFIISSTTGLLFSMLDSGKPFIYVIQLFIIYLYFMIYVDSEKYISLIINSWIMAIFLGALVLIMSFLTGKILLNFAVEDSKQFIEKGTIGFFQASYYYAGFHFVVGIAFVIIFFRIMLSKNNRFELLINTMIIAVLGIALVLMFNKSAILAMIITVLMIYFYLFSRFKNELARQSLYIIIIIMVVVVALINYVGSYLFVNVDLMMGGFTSGGSILTRFEVVQSALAAFVSYPIQIIIGMGPTFIESGNQLIASRFKVSSVTGGIEGTVDSGWVFYLIELGSVSVFLFLTLIVKSLKIIGGHIKSAGYLNICNSPPLWIFGGIMFTVIELFTQTLGYSKITWMPFQFMLMAFFYHRKFKA